MAGLQLVNRKQEKTTANLWSNRICCVPECTTGYSLIEGHGKPSYHAFPDVNDPLRVVWLAKIRRDDKSFKSITPPSGRSCINLKGKRRKTEKNYFENKNKEHFKQIRMSRYELTNNVHSVYEQ